MQELAIIRKYCTKSKKRWKVQKKILHQISLPRSTRENSQLLFTTHTYHLQFHFSFDLERENSV